MYFYVFYIVQASGNLASEPWYDSFFNKSKSGPTAVFGIFYFYCFNIFWPMVYVIVTPWNTFLRRKKK